MLDKELIKQEIERQLYGGLYSIDAKATLQNLYTFIDSLPEEHNEDLEKAAVEAFKKIVDSGNNSFLEIFKAGAEWQKQHK